MSDLVGNHIVGFPTRRLIYYDGSLLPIFLHLDVNKLRCIVLDY